MLITRLVSSQKIKTLGIAQVKQVGVKLVTRNIKFTYEKETDGKYLSLIH